MVAYWLHQPENQGVGATNRPAWLGRKWLTDAA
jgi:hypothetical protein